MESLCAFMYVKFCCNIRYRFAYIFQDSSLNRTTNGTGTVSSYTFEQLSQFDAAYSYPEYRNKGIKIPSLEQIVEYVLPHASVKMFIGTRSNQSNLPIYIYPISF